VTRRIAISQRVVDLPDRGERRDALDQAWAGWFAAAGFVPFPIPNRIEDPAGWCADLDVVAIVLSGGNDLAHLPGAAEPAPERDALERALVDHAARTATPLLGVCRGMQMMVEAWGGRIERVDGHVARPHDLVLLDDALPLRHGPVNSFHGWGVPAGGTGTLLAIAAAPDGTVEAVRHPELSQAGVMWHPERAVPDPADAALLHALIGDR
jgi:putative glutamine amidotransferase